MGRNRNKRKRPQNESYDKSKQGSWETGNGGIGYADIVKENAKFEQYYKAQGIVPDDQWQSFMSCLRESLPCTFRITGCRREAKAMLKIVESDFLEKLVTDEVDGGPGLEKPFSLPWYPDKLAWQLNLTRKVLRKSAMFGKLHNFLVSETGSGNISRQEAVSMIPPLVLDVQPHHKVLDMCAAPGSKTSQIIEMLHSDDDRNGVPSGVVVANDMDNKRCYMLVHQVKRLHSPCLVITNHDAGAMPNIKLASGRSLQFDRILCDVPCSGDGTLRKNIDIWKKWNPANSLNFHCLQARILKRGLELLAVGGNLVYSTCSLSPIENESVIHHMLNVCHGSVVLVEIGQKLPGLKFSRGLSNWKVLGRDLQEVANADSIDSKHLSYIRPCFFPPSQEEAEKYNLNRCIRVLPHVQNTGGFFVALLEKVKPLPWESTKGVEGKDNATCDTDKTEEQILQSPAPKKKKMFGAGYREDPFVYLTADEKLWPPIRDFYKISPDMDHTLFLTRTLVGMKRTLYLTSALVKEVVTNNHGHLKVINTGIRVFHRSDKKGSTCDFRLVQEGLKTLMPFMNGRTAKITKADVVTLLTHDFPFFTKLSIESKRQLQELGTGSITLIHDGEGFEDCPIVLCGWNGQVSLRAYLRKDEKMHILRLCGIDTAKFEVKKLNSAPEDVDESENAVVESGITDVLPS